MPHGEAALAESRCDLARAEPVDREGKGRHAAVHPRNAVDPARRRQAGEEALPERSLPADDRRPADRLDVLDGRDHPREQLEGLRARLEAVAEGLARLRSHLVRTPALRGRAADERNPEVRTEELVRRADEHVEAERLHVDLSVRAVMDGVGPRECARCVRQLRDALRVGQGSNRVRGEREGDDPGPVGELPLEVVHVEPAVLVDVDEADDEIAVVRQLEPGRDVAVVVEPRDEDLVTGAEFASDGAREREVERRHVRPEHDLLGRAAEEPRGGRTSPVEQLLGAPARLVRPADIGVRLPQVGGDRLDHRVRHLCPAGAVEQDEIALEHAEASARAVEVERRGGVRHASCPFTRHA